MQRTWSPDIFTGDQVDPIRHSIEDYKIHNKDCTDCYSRMKPNSVDLLLTDPPYGTTRNGWDAKELRDTLDATWRQWLRIVKPNCAIVVMSASPFDEILVMSQLSLYGYD